MPKKLKWNLNSALVIFAFFILSSSLTFESQVIKNFRIIINYSVQSLEKILENHIFAGWESNAYAIETKTYSSDISVYPADINFGTIKVGRTSTPSVIFLSNTGYTDLHISNIYLWDTVNYSLDLNDGNNPCGNATPTIAPNDSCTVTITFNPTITGQIDGNLVISLNEPETPSVNVSLSGIGTLPWCGCEFYPDTTIVKRGETLSFLANVTNYTSGVWSFYYATNISKPDGNWYPDSGFLIGPIKIVLSYHESKFKYISHFIPYSATLGIYTYHGYVGMPGYIWDECIFDFTIVE